MVNYNCQRCGYTTNIKTIMLRHYNRKKVCNPVLDDIDINLLKDQLLNDQYNKNDNDNSKKTQNDSINNLHYSKMTQNDSINDYHDSKMTQNDSKMTQNNSNIIIESYPKKTYKKSNKYEDFSSESSDSYKSENVCKFCERSFSRKNNLARHLKTCKEKKKDDEDRENLLNLVNMLNQQLKDQRDEFKQELNKRDKQIDELIKKAGVNIGTQNIQQNIKILAYKNTDLSHLTDQDYLQCLNRSNMVIPNLIKKIHFNPKKPENHNIYISNIRNKYIMVYDGNKWNLSNQNETIEDLIDTNEIVIEQKLEEWLENGKEYPEIMKKFNRYLEKKEKDDVINKIKNEIKLILYNNRKVANNCIE